MLIGFVALIAAGERNRFTYIYAGPLSEYTSLHPDWHVSIFWQMVSNKGHLLK
jgi:hypothetical protein